MPIPKDTRLYAKARALADKTYAKPSAYKSGFLVKTYKRLFREKHGDSTKAYESDRKEKALKRWFQEKWISVGGEYPTYRPTRRINKLTPKTVGEISRKRLSEQIRLKQKIRGTRNLPKF